MRSVGSRFDSKRILQAIRGFLSNDVPADQSRPGEKVIIACLDG